MWATSQLESCAVRRRRGKVRKSELLQLKMVRIASKLGLSFGAPIEEYNGGGWRAHVAWNWTNSIWVANSLGFFRCGGASGRLCCARDASQHTHTRVDGLKLGASAGEAVNLAQQQQPRDKEAKDDETMRSLFASKDVGGAEGEGAAKKAAGGEYNKVVAGICASAKRRRRQQLRTRRLPAGADLRAARRRRTAAASNSCRRRRRRCGPHRVRAAHTARRATAAAVASVAVALGGRRAAALGACASSRRHNEATPPTPTAAAAGGSTRKAAASD